MPEDQLVPEEVRAIATHWAGLDPVIYGVRLNEWGARGQDFEESFIYEISAPHVPVWMYEDSGQPAGQVVSAAWTVRALNDAPDAVWEIDVDGQYNGHGGPYKVPGWPA